MRINSQNSRLKQLIIIIIILNQLQSKPVDMHPESIVESVRIDMVSILSGLSKYQVYVFLTPCQHCKLKELDNTVNL